MLAQSPIQSSIFQPLQANPSTSKTIHYLFPKIHLFAIEYAIPITFFLVIFGYWFFSSSYTNTVVSVL